VLHLVIVTREDPLLPLAHLRARRQIAELRADQLRFTADEAAAFLNELMGLPLTAADIAALEVRTEGWIAGLQLAALAMQDRADYTGFMAAFTGSHRFVVDYLADEVLSRQPPSIQTFLLQTSILDRMCGPLCDAVLGIGDWGLEVRQNPQTSNPQSPAPSPQAYSQLLLEQLERANLFVTPLDAERRWYRYHHLFGEVLRERLRNGATTAEIATLYRRASAWYEQNGLLTEAVQHALAADDYSLAARLIESLARPMQLRGEMITVMEWLTALPADVLRTHAHLGVIYAWGLATTGQLPAAEVWIQDVERSLAEHPERSNLLGEVTVIRVVIALIQGDYLRTLTLGHQALTHLSDEQLPLRALTNMSLGAAYTAQGDLEAAGQSFAQASALYQAAGHVELALAPLRQLCRVQLVRGRLNQLEQTAQQALRLASQWGQRSSLVGYTYLSLGELCYQRNDLVSAERHFAHGLALVDLGGTKDIMNVINLADGHLGLARVKHLQGDPEGALEHIQQIELIVEQLAIRMQPRERQAGSASARPTPLLSYFDLIAAFRVWLWLSQGDIAAASQWMQTSGMRLDGDIALSQEVGFITVARVLIAQGEYERALALLARLLVATEAGGRMGRVIELLTLQALALHAQSREIEALATLERALLLAEPEGYIRAIVDVGPHMAMLLRAAQTRSSVPGYVAKLLAAFPHDDKLTKWQGDKVQAIPDQTPTVSPPHLVIPSLVEPLSERELEVLQLLVAGLSNQEIADQLVIALSTVKKHLNNVYTKLAVESRTQATARARELHLV
jgi:LuxR family maltose regulon positive regulatory protein